MRRKFPVVAELDPVLDAPPPTAKTAIDVEDGPSDFIIIRVDRRPPFHWNIDIGTLNPLTAYAAVEAARDYLYTEIPDVDQGLAA